MMKKALQKESSIILVRHGETEWNRLHRFQGRSDIPLNTHGEQQAQALALALRNTNLTAIYTSPLQRAADTARHIMKFHPTVPLSREEGLMEMDLGDFEGMEGKQWAASYPDFRSDWEKSPAALAMPGGECLEDVQERALQVVTRIVSTSDPGSTLLLCSHNFVIVCLLCFAADIPLDRFREMRQETAAMNVIYTDGTDWRIGTVNDRRHLDALDHPSKG